MKGTIGFIKSLCAATFFYTWLIYSTQSQSISYYTKMHVDLNRARLDHIIYIELYFMNTKSPDP
jgi:hypothetical protein